MDIHTLSYVTEQTMVSLGVLLVVSGGTVAFQEVVMGWQRRLCSLLSLMVGQIRCVSLQRFQPMWV